MMRNKLRILALMILLDLIIDPDKQVELSNKIKWIGEDDYSLDLSSNLETEV